jgi:hypothetical protein
MAETKKVTYMYSCPKGHGPTFAYDPDELRKELDNETLRHFCITCGDFYPSTPQERANLRKRLEEVSAS